MERLHVISNNAIVKICTIDDENAVMITSPQTEHTIPCIPTITNGDISDFHYSLSEDVVKPFHHQQQLRESQLVAQRKRDDFINTKPVSQHLHSTGVDAVLVRRVTIVQAHVRGHLTRKHLEPLRIQTRAATTIQAYW